MAKELPLEIKQKEVGISFRLIPAGAFLMGSSTIEADRAYDETTHQVELNHNFWMGKYEVTQAQWQAIMGNNPSQNIGVNNPVEKVSWNDCQEFIKKLNEKFKDKLPKDYVFDLPTEAQWEYACRAGTTTPFYFGDNIDSSQVNSNNILGKTVPIGSYSPNAWGLYDMHGNVAEWCSDFYKDNLSNAVTDHDDFKRVNRGGSWNASFMFCRSAYRGKLVPEYRDYRLGFRIVLRNQLAQ